MIGLRLGFASAPTLSARGGSALDRILGTGGLDYAFWDAGFRDGLFTDAIGPTPAAANGDAPGLWIDIGRRRRRTLPAALAGSPQLVANADFAGGVTGWTAPNGAAAAQGDGWMRVSSTDGSTSGRLRQIIPTDVGALYAVTYQCRAGTGGRPRLQVQVTDNPTGPVMTRTPPADGVETVYFVSTDATNTRVVLYAPNNTIGSYADYRLCEVRKVPGHYGIQPTAGYKPVLQAQGVRFDGLDDSLLTDWYARAGANCILAQVDVPAAPSGDQFIAGAMASSGDRFRIGIQASTGKALAALGAQLITATAGPDLRGSTAVVGLAFDGANASVFVNDAVTNAFAQGSDLPTTTIPSRLGAANSNGTATGYFGGAIRRVAFGRVAPTLAHYLAIRADWLNA